MSDGIALVTRLVLRAAALSVFAATLLASCSCGVVRDEDGGDGTATASGSRMCQLLSVQLAALEKEGLTVEDALTEPGKDGVGLRAGFAFLQIDDVPGAAPYAPALRYLSARWNEESVEGKSHPAPPSAAVVDNARKLDEFLAGGGCG